MKKNIFIGLVICFFSATIINNVNGQTAAIFGTVFNDLNENGLQDLTEPGITGATISVSGPSGPFDTLTNAYGQYSFVVDSAGFYIVSEANPLGYRSTTPDTVTVLVEVGQGYQVDFGDKLKIVEIHGTVFDDRNIDGILCAAETGIPGVRIVLEDQFGGVQETITVGNGQYTFRTSVQGQHRVTSSGAGPSYFPTTPESILFDVVGGMTYKADFGYGVTPTTPPNNFPKISPTNNVVDQPLVITISWSWENSPGSTYQYCVDTINNNLCDTVWTNVDTSCPTISAIINNLNPSTTYYWQVRAVNSYGNTESDGGAWWTFTTLSASIGDIVWNDIDGDGVQDAGEPGIDGIIVYIDLNSNNILDGGEPNATTTGGGMYDIIGLLAGSYEVSIDSATVPTGFVLTTANVPLNVILAAGEDYNNADFGYQQHNFPWWSFWPTIMKAVQDRSKQ